MNERLYILFYNIMDCFGLNRIAVRIGGFLVKLRLVDVDRILPVLWLMLANGDL